MCSRETCNDAIALTESDYGTVASPGDSYWYTHASVQRHVQLCSCGNGCDTRLYIYDYCQMGNLTTPTKAPFITTTTKEAVVKRRN